MLDITDITSVGLLEWLKNRFLLSTLTGLGLMSQCFTSPKYWGYNFQQISEGFNMSQMRTMVLEYFPTKFWAIWGVNVGKYSSTMEHFNVFYLVLVTYRIWFS